jgi:hypothetical protein
MVSGKTPPNKYFNVWVRTALGNSYRIYSHSNALGNYFSDFTSQVDLVSGQPMSIQIYYPIPASGNALDYFKGYGLSLLDFESDGLLSRPILLLSFLFLYQ